jgi:hypothetical protein
MCDRSLRWKKCWPVVGLGQLHPVLFGWEHGGVTLRIEGTADRHGKPSWCWWILPLATCKARAKIAFAELEHCKMTGVESPAARLWREYKETERVPA